MAEPWYMRLDGHRLSLSPAMSLSMRAEERLAASGGDRSHLRASPQAQCGAPRERLTSTRKFPATTERRPHAVTAGHAIRSAGSKRSEGVAAATGGASGQRPASSSGSHVLRATTLVERAV